MQTCLFCLIYIFKLSLLQPLIITHAIKFETRWIEFCNESLILVYGRKFTREDIHKLSCGGEEELC